MRPNEVFFSHANEDRGVAGRLASVLTEHGIPVWFSPRNLMVAQQWHDEIGAALERCDAFLLLLSPYAVSSKWVKRELLFALQEDRYDERIYPVLATACDFRKLSWTLGLFEMVDLGGDFEAGCRELLRSWGVGYRGPTP